jgi:capsular polysaccharide export protein
LSQSKNHTHASAHTPTVFVTLSRGVAKLPFLPNYLGGAVVRVSGGLSHFHQKKQPRSVKAVVGWGRRPGTDKAQAFAQKNNLPYVCLEDGFLRSFGTGESFPPLSLIVDTEGVYYDSRTPSTLENILNSPKDVLAENEFKILQAKELILKHGLSKYNHAPPFESTKLAPGKRVLVVDQTNGDMSVTYGAADQSTFDAMLAAAQIENPDATIYVKTHPEVSSGRKKGYLSHVKNAKVVMLQDLINPISLIREMHIVYVVTSTMGFEALLHGKRVVCFGVPWYAGWGVTEDRQVCARRSRSRSINELFAAAYWHYSRYINPLNHQPGQLADVIDWVVRQKQMAQRLQGSQTKGRLIGLGFARWKAYNLKPMFAIHPSKLKFVGTQNQLLKLTPTTQDTFVVWGANTPTIPLKPSPSLTHEPQLTPTTSLPHNLLRLEDGFIRSVGLGSDLIRPLSIVIDGSGIYFDASKPSDLEHLLNTVEFDQNEIERAQNVRAFIVQHQITKYNHEPHQTVDWGNQNELTILVPGQVEDDASIQLGCTTVKTNLQLLQAVRIANPSAYIVYKPHPDVMSGNRKGLLHVNAVKNLVNYIEKNASIVSCIEACDELHTMTSLSGFDALIRQKKVVTYGQPFYAGWGLTQDNCVNAVAFKRRIKTLSLDQLVVGALLRYPVYFDWSLKGYTTCEAVLNQIVSTRSELEARGELDQLNRGYVLRQLRKLKVWLPAFFARS